ncbi:MAG: hypothetical protein HY318_11020 [Armatimonadetes bacterium]|nr:hypothetical protein [Armatimonadota bacterium]
MLLYGFQEPSFKREVDGFIVVRAMRDFSQCPNDEQWMYTVAFLLSILRRSQEVAFAYLTDVSNQMARLSAPDLHYAASLPQCVLKGEQRSPEAIMLDVSRADLSIVVIWMYEEECLLLCLPCGWTLASVRDYLRETTTTWDVQVRQLLAKGGFAIDPMADGFGIRVATFDYALYEQLCCLIQK